MLLSEKTDGDYIVRRFMIRSRNDADYSIRYQINLATLNAALSGNPKELDELSAFVGDLIQDTSARVQAVTITGYASPDGPVAFNKALATRRTDDFKTYVDRKYGFSNKYKVSVKSVAEDWDMCRALVARSAVPEREAALRIIDSGRTPEQKEAALKAMPATWDYMKETILPPLRRVELTIDYGSGHVVEKRTRIARPKPAPAAVVTPVRNVQPAPAPQECECVVVEDVATGLIVEMPEPRSGYRRRVYSRRMENMNIDREARHELRIAEQMDRQQEKAAQQIARKEAKAMKKAEKAARKSARELRKL